MTLRETMRSHSSIGASSMGPRSTTPPLLTTVSSRPSAAPVRSTAASAWPPGADAGAVVGVVPDDDPPPPHAPRVRARTTRPATAAGAVLMVRVSVNGQENLSAVEWQAVAVDAVIFDWGGTLSVFVEAELV